MCAFDVPLELSDKFYAFSAMEVKAHKHVFKLSDLGAHTNVIPLIIKPTLEFMRCVYNYSNTSSFGEQRQVGFRIIMEAKKIAIPESPNCNPPLTLMVMISSELLKSGMMLRDYLQFEKENHFG